MADEIYLPRIPDGRFDAIVASARAAGIKDIPNASRWRDLVLLWQSEYVGPNIRWVDVEEVPF